MGEVPTWYALLGFVIASGCFVAGVARALTPPRAAETAFVRSVLRQLYAEGGYDDGVLYVSVTRGVTLGHEVLGWTLHGPERHGWTESRAVLIQWLREHYRAQHGQAQREVA